jgi:cysteine-rich repeat protein
MRTRWPLLASLGLVIVAACAESAQNRCGDGSIGGVEQCDDGNNISGDGCSATCQVESSGDTCGDGVVGLTEQCDDMNTASDDGCSATCMIEPGYTCTGMPSVCTMATPAGTCEAPFIVTLTEDDGMWHGTATGDTTSSTDQVMAATCDGFESGAGRDHIWRFTLTETSDVVVMTDDTSAFDTVIRVLTSPCDLATEVAEFGDQDGCSDGDGPNEFLGFVALPAGSYYVVLDGYEATDFGTYAFDVYTWPTTCGDGFVDFLEFCDDGNTANDDGCNSRCEVETGYTCDDSEPSMCTTNAMVAPAPGDLVLNEFLAGDNMSDSNCDGSITGTADEFVELVNVSQKMLNLTGVTISDSLVVRHVFAATTLAPGEAIVVWAGGTPMCPGVTKFATASTGHLSLNDNGDTIRVATAGTSPTTLIEVTYPAVTLNVSSNLSPELTGTTYVLHTAVSGAVGNWSPGKRADGTAF